ncbi:MAG TPA: hypothetical protein VIU61_07910 [Kofleriaceae bacterium]
MRAAVLVLALLPGLAHADPKTKPIEGMADVVLDLSRAVMNLGAGPFSRALIYEPPPGFADARPYGQGGMVIKPPDIDRDMVIGRVTIESTLAELLGRLLEPWLWKSS